MSKVWHAALTIFAILLILGMTVAGVGMLTGGSVSRILHTTDIANMTKFFSREQIEMVVSFFFK